MVRVVDTQTGGVAWGVCVCDGGRGWGGVYPIQMNLNY